MTPYQQDIRRFTPAHIQSIRASSLHYKTLGHWFSTHWNFIWKIKNNQAYKEIEYQNG